MKTINQTSVTGENKHRSSAVETETNKERMSSQRNKKNQKSKV